MAWEEVLGDLAVIWEIWLGFGWDLGDLGFRTQSTLGPPGSFEDFPEKSGKSVVPYIAQSIRHSESGTPPHQPLASAREAHGLQL